MTSVGWARVRSGLDDWFGVAVLAAVALAVLGGVLAHGAYVEPGTHQEQRVVDEWRVNGSFTHYAVIDDRPNLTPFEDGERARDRAVYFQRVMPVLEGEFTLATSGGEAPINLTIDRRLVVESTERTTGDEAATVYWRDVRPLGTNRTVHEPGTTTTAPFGFNVTRTIREARNVSDRLQSPGQVRAEVLVTVVATRQAADAQTRRLTYRLPITSERGIYRVDDRPSSETFTERRTVTVATEPGVLRRFGGPLLVVVGLVGTAALAYGRRIGAIALSDEEREWLAYRDHRADFDDWITTIRLPAEARDLPVAEAETLGDLVDLAIDTDSAVTEEPGGGTYHVVHDGYRYTFDAPTAPTADDPLDVTESETESEGDPSGPSDTPDEADPIADGAGAPVDGED